MATLEQLSTALKNADAAGDVPAAQKLAAAIKQMQAQGVPAMSPAPAPSPVPAQELSWASVPGQAVANIGPSAGRFAGDIGNVIMHPIQTAQNIAGLGAGAVEKLIPGTQPQEKYADAFGQAMANRYGGIDKIKATMATDPVGFLADASLPFSGGAGLLSKIPRLASTANVVAKVGRAIDPITNAAKVVGKASNLAGKVASESLGLSTGAGGLPFRTAFSAGYSGGPAAQAFTENMRGAAPMEDAVSTAKRGLQAIKSDRQAAYKAGMSAVGQDTTVLDFNKIDNAMANVRKTGEFQGKTTGIIVKTNPAADAAMKEINNVLSEWRQLPPQDFHTAEGFDALKKRLGDIVDAAPPGSPAQKAATQAYNIVKDQIVAQAPQYAKVMKGYEEASSLIREMESALSLNRKANIDTALRKLQSVMRNNVNTTYGRRVDLTQMLQDAGASNLLERLAGQSLNQLTPRGIARGVAPMEMGGAAVAGLMNPALIPPMAGVLMSQSPRLMGEASYFAGKGARGMSKIPMRGALRGAYQLNQERTRP